VDVVHGHARIAARPGQRVRPLRRRRVRPRARLHSVSRMGAVLDPRLQQRQRDRTTYAGRFLAVDRGTPADVWMAAQCDYLLQYEWSAYTPSAPLPTPTGDARPPAPSHRAHSGGGEAAASALRVPGQPPLKDMTTTTAESLDADAGTDPRRRIWPATSRPITPTPTIRISSGLDSAYGAARSAIGPPTISLPPRAETASRGPAAARRGVRCAVIARNVASPARGGCTTGGTTRQAMAALDARLAREIREAGAAGGILFSWLDEWFKHTGSDRSGVAAERTRLWHNVMIGTELGLLNHSSSQENRIPPGGARLPDLTREAARRGRPSPARRAPRGASPRAGDATFRAMTAHRTPRRAAAGPRDAVSVARR